MPIYSYRQHQFDLEYRAPGVECSFLKDEYALSGAYTQGETAVRRSNLAPQPSGGRLTSSRAQIDIPKSYELNANGYIVKPVPFERLREIAASIKSFWFAVVVLPAIPANCPSAQAPSCPNDGHVRWPET